MTRRMTIVFDDEELYTRLKVAAARAHRPAKDIVAEALCLYFAAADEPNGEQTHPARRLVAQPAETAESVLRDLGLAREASSSAR